MGEGDCWAALEPMSTLLIRFGSIHHVHPALLLGPLRKPGPQNCLELLRVSGSYFVLIQQSYDRYSYWSLGDPPYDERISMESDWIAHSSTALKPRLSSQLGRWNHVLPQKSSHGVCRRRTCGGGPAREQTCKHTLCHQVLTFSEKIASVILFGTICNV